MAKTSKAFSLAQIGEAILNSPHVSHAPPSDDPAREEAGYQATFSPPLTQ